MNERKTVLVTGATSGVGYATAMRLLSDAGRYTVYATGRAPDKLSELQNEGAIAIPADVTNKDEMANLLKQIGSIDIVIFSAGVGHFEAVHLLPDEEIRSMMDTNVIAPIELTKRILPQMMEQQGGQLIYIGSQAGKVATPKEPQHIKLNLTQNAYSVGFFRWLDDLRTFVKNTFFDYVASVNPTLKKSKGFIQETGYSYNTYYRLREGWAVPKYETMERLLHISGKVVQDYIDYANGKGVFCTEDIMRILSERKLY